MEEGQDAMGRQDAVSGKRISLGNEEARVKLSIERYSRLE
jgi:hypothetical protein